MKSRSSTIFPCPLNSLSWGEKGVAVCKGSNVRGHCMMSPSARFRLLTYQKWTASRIQKILKFFPTTPVQGKFSRHMVEPPSKFIPWSHEFFEQFEKLAQTGKEVDGWKCKYEILMSALPSHLKGDGKYFMPCSAWLQASGTINEIVIIFSKRLELVCDIS